MTEADGDLRIKLPGYAELEVHLQGELLQGEIWDFASFLPDQADFHAPYRHQHALLAAHTTGIRSPTRS